MWDAVRMAAVSAALAITVGAAKADTYQTYDITGSYTTYSGATDPVNAVVTYDLTTQTFTEFDFGYVEVSSNGANYAGYFFWSGEQPADFEYPPGSTISGRAFDYPACADAENCPGIIINEDLVQTLVQTEVTPLPAALPLFAGGLGMIGLFGRRRKRKAEHALAAA